MNLFKRILLLTILFFTIISCSTLKKKYNISSELSKKELQELGYVSLFKKYKYNYPVLIPYLYNNSNDNFIEFQGDFYNIRLANNDDLNILCNYDEKSEENNIIRCMIRKSSTSKIDFKNHTISMKSSRNGVIELKKVLNQSGSYVTHPALLFYKKIAIEKPMDIVKKIKNDTITITINNQVFEFISPEFD